MTGADEQPGGFRHVGDVIKPLIENLEFRQKMMALRRKGDRVYTEFWGETAMDLDPVRRTRFFQRVDRFLKLDDDVLAAIGGDRMPTVPPPRAVD